MSKQDFAVIFDMDGVLVDSVRFHWQAMNQVLARSGIRIDDSQLRNYIGQSVVHQLNQISQKFGVSLDVDVIIEELKPIKEELQKEMPPKDGVVQLLKMLHGHSIPVAIGTSSTTLDTNRKLVTAGITNYFDELVTHDDVTEHKPDPAVYLMAADKLRFPPSRCIVFEDAPSGILAAKRAGMTCVAVRTPVTVPEDLAGADIAVDSLRDVNLEFMQKLIG